MFGSHKLEIEIKKDGRVILRGLSYHKMRVELCDLAQSHCENKKCGRYTPLDSGEAHHQAGRGGGRRDDRIFIKKKRNIYWYCKPCHSGKHIPNKVVPKKPTAAEFKEILGL